MYVKMSIASHACSIHTPPPPETNAHVAPALDEQLGHELVLLRHPAHVQGRGAARRDLVDELRVLVQDLLHGRLPHLERRHDRRIAAPRIHGPWLCLFEDGSRDLVDAGFDMLRSDSIF